jgi:hypothetical protein
MVRDTTSILPEGRPEPLIKSPEGSEYSINTYSRRDTLFQKAEEEEGPVLLKVDFQELLRSPEALYKEIVKLILKIYNILTYSKNYYNQLRETKQAL